MEKEFNGAEPGRLPDISNFERMVNAAPVGPNTLNPFKFWRIKIYDFFSVKPIEKEFPEGGLDATYILWHDFETIEARTQRLMRASQISSLPALEKKDVDEVAQRNHALVSQFRDNLIRFVEGNFSDWSLAEKAMSAAIQFNKIVSEPRENQIIAFCEAINEVGAEKELQPEFIRQRIAQWLIEEMFTEGAQYAALYLHTDYGDPRTVLRDNLEQEKDELKAALHSGLWDSETLARREGEFKRLLSILYHKGYSRDDGEIIKLEELWGSAKGEKKNLEEISVIKLMDYQDRIYKSLVFHQIFDIKVQE